MTFSIYFISQVGTPVSLELPLSQTPGLIDVRPYGLRYVCTSAFEFGLWEGVRTGGHVWRADASLSSTAPSRNANSLTSSASGS